ncbi:MAG TPA: MFS transporter [Candidatus Limnocylindrales bacterium]
MSGPLGLGLPVGQLPALRHRNYRLFFAGQGLSLVGTWMTAVAQSWLVLQLTGSAFDLGLIGVFQFTPVLILGLFGGIIADALPKRSTMYVTQAIAMGVSFILFVLSATHTVQLWHVYLLAVVMGVRNAIDMPTRQAFAVEMVGREDVGNAVALNSAMFNGARIVGPAVAGLVIGSFGVAPAFLVDAFSFLAVLGALFAMDPDTLRSAPRIDRPDSVRAVVDNLAEGLGYVRTTSIVLLAVIVIGVVATFGMNFSIVIPPLAAGPLNVGAAGYGFLMAASGAGSLLAALFIAFRGTRPSRLLTGALLLGVADCAVGISRSYPADLVLMFVAGAGAISMMATANTTMQLAVPDHLRGRVMSVYTTVFAGTTPIGALATGAVAASAGADVAIFLGGGVSLVAGLAGIIWYRNVQRAGGVPEILRTNRTRRAATPAVAREGAGGPPAPVASPRAMPGDVASR